MKIERLQIHGFGRMKDTDIRFGAPLTVLNGPNEAGKSTILQFVRAMLYGIPSRAYPAERYEPPGGGRHGGVLTARAADGSVWTVSRYAAPDQRMTSGRSEQLTIIRTDEKGTANPMSQSDLERELLGGMSRDMFKQLFAVTLTELQEIRTLQSDEMGSYLFHAGFGAGGEIMRAERVLSQRMDKLYKPRGRVQESAKVLQAIERLQREIAESRSYLSQYMDAEDKLLEAERNLKDADQRRTDASRRLVILRKAAEIRPQWLAWREAISERHLLPEAVPFPEEGLQRWRKLRDDQDRIQLQLHSLERRIEETTMQLSHLRTDEELISQGLLIEKLAGRRQYIEMRMKEQQELFGEESALQGQLQRLLRQIHAEWGVSELRDFSGSVPEREAVRRYASGFAGYDRRIEGLAQEREQKAIQLASADDELKRAEATCSELTAAGKRRFDMLRPQTKPELLSAWNELQSAAELWRETRLNRLSQKGLEEREALISGRMKALYRKLLWGNAALTLILPALLWTFGSAWGAVSVLLVLIFADGMLWRGSLVSGSSRSRGRREYSHEPHTEEERLSALMADLITHPQAAAASASGSLGGSLTHSEDSIESSLRELRKLVDAWLAWHDDLERSRGEAGAAKRRSEALRHDLSALTRKMEEEHGIFTKLESQWQMWLQERGLEASCSPDAVMDMFGFAEQGMEIVRRMDALERKGQLLSQEIAAFKKDCLFISIHGEERDDADLLMRLELKKKEWERQQELLRRREAASMKLEPLQEELFALKEEQGRLELAAKHLLAEGQSVDGEAFLRTGAAMERRKELDRSIRQLEIGMFSGWSGESERSLRETLEHYDAAALDEACRSAEQRQVQADKEWNELQQLRGRWLQERDHLVKLCAHDTALQQLEEQKALLKGIAGEYAVLAICAEMIGRTRSVYEQEKQPEVLKLASSYFKALTGGSYSRIVMKLGEKKLLAEHREAGLLDSSLLSRGTAEQLYLAMRFAFAGSMNGRASVPLLLDDLFVNFDEERLCSALDLAGNLSADRQVIMFTCHRYMVDHAVARIPHAEIIRI